MWKKTHSIVVKHVSREQIWKLFSDVNNWVNWDTTIEKAHIDGNFEVGNTFILQPKWAPEFHIEIIEATPNQSFTDLTRFPLARMYGIHTFEDVDEGMKMTTTIRIEWILSWIWRKIVAENIMKNIDADMHHQADIASKL